MAKKKSETVAKKRDLYMIDDDGRQTDRGLHEIDDKGDKDFVKFINNMYRTAKKK